MYTIAKTSGSHCNGCKTLPGFCKRAFQNFFTELGGSKELKTAMEKLYKQTKREVDILLHHRTVKGFEELVLSIGHLSHAYDQKAVREVSLTGLAMEVIHMHLNRLFIFNQCYFEMIHYYLLYRALFRDWYRSR